MEARRFTHEDYPTVVEWWNQHKWIVIPENALPVHGMIVDDVACAWLYLADGGLCLLEWYISNKDANREDRGEALELIIDELIKIAEDKNQMYIISSVMIPRLAKRLEDKGFQVTDKNMTNLVRAI